MKSTLRITDDKDGDSGRVSPPYGVVQPPDLPQRSDLDLKRSTTTRQIYQPNQSTGGLFCCTATKAVRRTYIDWTLSSGAVMLCFFLVKFGDLVF